ncbi:PTS sugar transporter subunit IIA [Companilactobacillus sp. HBUAS56257]|uniref:PTS sugar transporter subunit IIA n=1 Tax=Companilactobacillus sp. HBUAS56257 TaxID=3109360 RepID=UPI002FEFDABB
MEIPSQNILLDVNVSDRDDLLKFISSKCQDLGYTDSSKELYDSFLKREADYSTGLQEGFAIPHAKTDAVKSAQIVYVRTTNPIDWKTYDDKPVTDIFALMVPESGVGTTHLQMLSNLATALLEDDFKKEIRELNDSQKISDYITKKIGVNVL